MAGTRHTDTTDTSSQPSESASSADPTATVHRSGAAFDAAPELFPTDDESTSA